MNFLEKIKKNWVIILLLIIVAVGIFLRTYNFESWLFFQSDQARDLNVVNRAVVNGPGWLPLLGPKAGGTFLRLGPIFYYFEYLAVLIFGTSSPAIVAFPDLLFSILSLPLFFLFLREFFSKKYSLLLTAGYAVCFFEIQYARFAWNPNSLPFFNLLFFYATFKLFQSDDGKAKTWWAIVIGTAYAIVSQLHFVSLLSLPIALAVIFVIRKIFFKNNPEKWWTYLGIMISIFFVFYIPVILSDLQLNGNNTLNFLKSFGEKGAHSVDVISLLLKDVFVFSKYLLVILAGIVDASKLTTNIFSGMLFFFALAAIIAFKKETLKERKFFILLILVWFVCYFVTYIPLGSTLQPRHFLVILPLAFVFVGALSYSLEKMFKTRYVSYVATIILLLPIAANVYSLKIWFSEITDSQQEISTYRKSPLLKSVGGESWWHLEKTAEFMRDDCEKNKLVILLPKESYRSLYDYAMQHVGEKRPCSLQWGSFSGDSDDTCFYVVGFAKNDFSNRFGGVLQKIKYVQFGDMAVTRFDIDDDPTIKNITNPFKKNNNGEIKIKYLDDSTKGVVDSDAGSGGIEDSYDDVVSDNNVDDSDVSAGSLFDGVGWENRLFWKDAFGG